MKTKTKTKACVCAGAIAAGLLLPAMVALFFGYPRYAAHARRVWKQKALPEIAKRAGDGEWVSGEIALLGNPDARHEQGVIAQGWLTDGMILMKSGEWLVYKSHCNKAPPHNVRDIFLAKGSDGKWYYSTCHFCVGMVALLMMQQEAARPYSPNPLQPRDLAFFVGRYHLREFDGVSDKCLEATATFPAPEPSPPPARVYTAERKPGLPHLSPLTRAAVSAITVATESDPDLKGHGLELCAVRYEHRFPRDDRPGSTTHTAIYRDDMLSGCGATGIDVQVKDGMAHFKKQKGGALCSLPLDGQLTVPDETLADIAIRAFDSFWPAIDKHDLSVDKIVYCDQTGGNRYVVSLELTWLQTGRRSTGPDTLIEMRISADGTVAEKDVRWNSP